MTFLAQAHPRGKGGRFVDHGRGMTFSQIPLGESGLQRRSLPSSSKVWRIGARTSELPIAYTGSRTKEHQVGTFLKHEFTPQIPSGVSAGEWSKLTRSLYTVANQERTATIDRGIENGYVPKDTPRAAVVRAYVHATKLALKQFQVVHYDFKMDDEQKAEMKPLVPFILYAQRRLMSKMLGAEKGAWRPYREAFSPLSAVKKNKRPTGEMRRRRPALGPLVKAHEGLIFASEALSKAAFASAQQMRQAQQAARGVLPAQGGLSRFARYRASIAREEAGGEHDLTPLTMAQRMQRVKAARILRQKVQNHAPRTQPGQPGSVAGQGLKRRYFAPTLGPSPAGPLPSGPGGVMK